MNEKTILATASALRALLVEFTGGDAQQANVGGGRKRPFKKVRRACALAVLEQFGIEGAIKCRNSGALRVRGVAVLGGLSDALVTAVRAAAADVKSWPLDVRETATVLTALRHYQSAGLPDDPGRRPVEVEQIVSGGNAFEPGLSSHEVDELCRRIIWLRDCGGKEGVAS